MMVLALTALTANPSLPNFSNSYYKYFIIRILNSLKYYFNLH